MRLLTTILSLFITCAALAQEQLTYAEWNEEAKTNIRLLPAYGHREKTEAQKEADNKFIAASLKTDGTPRKSSEHLVDLGWKYFYGDDIRTAMYRFNQAWLMDSTNENAYWGFGAVYSYYNDWDKALEMYDKGLAMNPGNAKIITDKATVYMGKYYAFMEEINFWQAEKLLLRSLDLEPSRQATLFKLSALYLAHNDCDKSVDYYEKCLAYGRGPITDDFIRDLKQKCGKRAAKK